MADLKKNYGVLFNRKTGKIIEIRESWGNALMRLWALNGNVSSTRDFVIFDEDGEIQFYCEGRKNDMPNICKKMEGKHIDTICKGLLEAMKND